jgi:SPP1 gp7 family putative phage head morphogenesis protein
MKSQGQTKASVQAALNKTLVQPKGITISYMAFLSGSQRKINAQIREALAPMRALLDVTRIDGARFDDGTDDLIAAFNSLRGTLGRLTGGASSLGIGILRHGQKTQVFNAKKYDSPTMNLLGIGDVSAQVEARTLKGWSAENVQLISNMNQEQFGKLETLFLRALRDGSRSSEIQSEVSGILNSSTNRARLIARDQIGKLNGQLDREKQVAGGVTQYVWRGSLDERERPGHVNREGDVFSWKKPPPNAGGGAGHPGQPIQCRCSAEPDLTTVLGPEFAPKPVPRDAFKRTTPEARAENRRKVAAKNRRKGKRRAKVAAVPSLPTPTPISPKSSESLTRKRQNAAAEAFEGGKRPALSAAQRKELTQLETDGEVVYTTTTTLSGGRVKTTGDFSKPGHSLKSVNQLANNGAATIEGALHTSGTIEEQTREIRARGAIVTNAIIRPTLSRSARLAIPEAVTKRGRVTAAATAKNERVAEVRSRTPELTKSEATTLIRISQVGPSSETARKVSKQLEAKGFAKRIPGEELIPGIFEKDDYVLTPAGVRAVGGDIHPFRTTARERS